MAQLKNLLVTGVSRFLNKVYASEFVGNLTGNVTGNVSGTATNVTGTVDISHGGTNATTAANARTNLGLGSAATYTAATTVGNNSNLPTGAAVQTYVTGLGYTKNTGTVTKVTAGTGLTGGDITTTGTIALGTSGVTAGSAGPTAAVTGNEGTTVAIPRLTVDTYGRVTALSSYNLTNKNTTYSAASTSANGLMSSADKTKLNNTNVFYGTCATAAGTAAKVVELTNGDNFQLIAGAMIGVKFTYSNSASNVTINVESKGAKQIWYNNAVYTGTSNHICGYANRVSYYMYDGTYWVWMNPSAEFNDNTIPSAYCSTAAGTAAKVASCSGYMENRDQTIQVIFTNTNTAASELTLNINSRGAHPIWIDGMASSSSNYEIPAGSYMAYYDHTQNIYHIRTDARLPVDSVTNLTNADFAVESIVSSQHSVSGGGITNVSFNIYKPGWCALTITGYNCANANVFIITMNPVLGKDYDPATRTSLAGASVTLAYGNKASSTQNFTPQIDVLYMRLKGRQVNSNYWGMDGTTIWDGA